MLTTNAVQFDRVRAGIARAAAETGVNFNYLLAQANIESGLDAQARASASSAVGLYQFVSGTWLDTIGRHGSRHGLDWAEAAVSRPEGGRIDPAVRQQILDLREDPEISAAMAAELARDNSVELGHFLGRAPDHAELYLAHFLGLGGAKAMLSAERTNPTGSAAQILPDAARSNQSVFYDHGAPRSVSEVINRVRSRFELASAEDVKAVGGAVAQWQVMPPPMAQGARHEFHDAAARFGQWDDQMPRRSMAETLRTSFSQDDRVGGRAAEHVLAAYDKFRAMGL